MSSCSIQKEPTHQGSSTTTSSTSEMHLLVQLSQACQKHALFHTTSQQHPGLLPLPDAPEHELPDTCRNDLAVLRQILPKVEASYFPKTTNTAAVTPGSHPMSMQAHHPTNIKHLCDFYTLVLNGGYCPHAPHLFKWGRDGVEIIPRVLWLFQYLTSRALIQNTVSSSLSMKDRETGATATTSKILPSSPVTTTICSTIARMLSLIPESSLQDSVVVDLLDMAGDLSVIQRVVSDGTVQLDPNDPIRLDLFPFTISLSMGLSCMSKSALSHAVLSFDAASWPRMASSLWSLQSATMTILYNYLDLHRQKNNDNAAIAVEIRDAVMAPHPQAHLHGIVDRNDHIRKLLSVIREQVVFSPEGYCDVLQQHAQMAALDLLDALWEDWNSSVTVSSPPDSVLREAVLVTTQGCERFVLARSTSRADRDEEEGRNKLNKEISAKYRKLLVTGIVLPPSKPPHALHTIRRTALCPLLDCLPHIRRRDQVDGQLSLVVLRAIHACIYTNTSSVRKDAETCSLLARDYCEARGLFVHLFQIALDFDGALPLQLTTSDLAVSIISCLLMGDSSVGQDRSLKAKNVLTEACRLALLRSPEEEKAGVSAQSEKDLGDASSAFDLPTHSNSESKRSARSQSTVHAEPLVIERSPKRQRRISGSSVSPSRIASTPRHELGPQEDGPSGRQTHAKSLQETLGAFLLQGRRWADRIIKTDNPCRDNVEAHEMGPLIHVVASVASFMMSVLSIMIREVDSEAACELKNNFVTPFELLNLLVRSLGLLATSVSSMLRLENADVASGSIQRAASSLTSVALHAHFTIDVARAPVVDSLPSLISFSDATAQLALLCWTKFDNNSDLDNGAVTFDDQGSYREDPANGVCEDSFVAELNRALSVVCVAKTCVTYGTVCLCGSCVPSAYVCPINDRAVNLDIKDQYQIDCSLNVLRGLRPQARWALFACLRPIESDIHHPCSFVASAGRGIAAPRPTFFAVELSPLYLVSQAVRRQRVGIGRGMHFDSTVAAVASLLSKARLDVLLDPNMTRRNQESHYLALCRFQELFNVTAMADKSTEPVDGDRYTAILRSIHRKTCCLLAFVSGRPLLSHVPNLDIVTVSKHPPVNGMHVKYRQIRNSVLKWSSEHYGEGPSPRIRMLKWRCVSRASSDSALSELRQICGPVANLEEAEQCRLVSPKSIVDWLIFAALADPDEGTRNYAAKRVGLLLFEGKGELFYALFSTDQEYNALHRDGLTRSDIAGPVSLVASRVVCRLFREIDHLLFKFCHVPTSQLSFTIGITTRDFSSKDVAGMGNEVNGESFSFQCSAVKVLGSFCQAVDVQTPCGMRVFENAMLRLVRFWTSTDKTHCIQTENGPLASTSVSACALCEIARVHSKRPLHRILQGQCWETFVPALFADILLPCASTTVAIPGIEEVSLDARANRARQFRLLTSFLKLFLIKPNGKERSISEVLTFVGETQAHVLVALIIEREYDLLKITTAYTLFLLGDKRREEKRRIRDETSYLRLSSKFVGKSPKIGGDGTKVPGLDTGAAELEKQTQALCLAPETIETILPRLLTNSDRSQLVFFLQIVLKNELSMHQMIRSREKPMLKAILWELGRGSEYESHTDQALQRAALAREQSTGNGSTTSHSEISFQSRVSTIRPTESETRVTADAVTRWMTPSFMYLLVNVVQKNINTETSRTLRSMKWMLTYLRADEAAQYIPQILSVVNTAMSRDSRERDSLTSDDTFGRRRFLAAQVLSQYVRLLAESQWETVGQNLTTFVVALFPALIAEEASRLSSNDYASHEAHKVAVDLLEWLTSGRLGKKLAPFFNDIPFLPSSPSLDPTRRALKTNGVDFDNHLVVTSTQNTQGLSARDSLASDGGSGSRDSETDSQKYTYGAVEALRKRIITLVALVSHEGLGVRRVVLRHLIDLLRCNRGLFHRLIEVEDSLSANRFLTVDFGVFGLANGSVTQLAQTLLMRCSTEEDPKTKILLAACWGEVGAIGFHRLGDVTINTSSSEGASVAWRLANAPWRSQPTRYQLHVVTTHLVVALKAARTAPDQHSIAYTIQQILVLLDKPASSQDVATKQSMSTAKEKGEMSEWLREKLLEADVLETIEPYWQSQFNVANEGISANSRTPPFFGNASSYFSWLSGWCRYMVNRSKSSRHFEWGAFLHSCRRAFRSPISLRLAEFILPLLILERLCFGDMDDEQMIVKEILDVLSLSASRGEDVPCVMPRPDFHKAVNTVFGTLDTLQTWSDDEIEKKGSQKRDMIGMSTESGGFWSSDESIARIQDLLQAIPLDVRSRAASCVGMHARALQLLEIAARATLAPMYDQTSKTVMREKGEAESDGTVSRAVIGRHILHGIDVRLLKDVLGDLNDYETFEGIMEDAASSLHAGNGIRQKEARGDWTGAVQDYERILQLNDQAELQSTYERGLLRCLLESGQFESVLNQVNGIINRKRRAGKSQPTNKRNLGALPFAVEAAWRLGRWSELEKILDEDLRPLVTAKSQDSEGLYQIAVGEAMRGLFRRSKQAVDSSLIKAREAVMLPLETVARESYTRAYPYLVKLHCLREIEDSVFIMCGVGEDEEPTDLSHFADVALSGRLEGWNWNGRLDVVASSECSNVVSARLALARLAGDPTLQGSLFLTTGKKARKAGQYHVAENSLAHAESAFLRSKSIGDVAGVSVEINGHLSSVQTEFAKLKHLSGDGKAALRILGLENISGLLDFDNADLRAFALTREHCPSTNDVSSKVAVHRFARRLVLSTKWMVEGGLKSGSEVMDRFRAAQKLSPKLEKGHFQFAKYVDSVLESRVVAIRERALPGAHQVSGDEDSARTKVLLDDPSCQQYVLLAMGEYIEALKLSSKHVFQVLPRLLSLWFDFCSVQKQSTARSKDSKGSTTLLDHQKEANNLLVQSFRLIPPQTFYTAMPQLISRIKHSNPDTAVIVLSILARILTKFPTQALWPLAWLRHSASAERTQVGEEIFRKAQMALVKRKDTRMSALLGSSKSLFRWLIDLAKAKPSDSHARSMSYRRAWKDEVDLIEYLPPIQAALSVSRSYSNGTNSRDVFPDSVPRMRTFCQQVNVMTSKARPKRVKAFVVSASMIQSRSNIADSGDANKRAQPGDIGELHFLLKQEAKGDLRKDARVQELNNVINRLMASSTTSQGGGSLRQRRRLQLRTFAVTCLSEDCGILEWVPNTDSIRSLLSKTYNPQAERFSKRRRGRHIANFSDPNLKTSFEKCQDAFIKKGDLSLAATMFEKLCLEPYPPLFYWWFVQNFRDPHAWYEARTRFTLSAAAWSAVGHVIGLGDRHSENILMDSTTGECVHVDFDCIFDKGLSLPRPEVIPFRLTPNMLDAFGPIGADGIFAGSLQTAMSTLRNNRDTLLSVLEPFLKDPIIDWKRIRSQQKQGKSSSSSSKGSSTTHETAQAKRSIKVIDERLRGIYNLRNPNYSKIQRTDGWSVDQDDEMTHLLPLSVEGQVHKMIAEATSHENLVQLYVGWMPWL